MGVISYALLAYGCTAVISLLVVAIIMGISRLTGGAGAEKKEDGES